MHIARYIAPWAMVILASCDMAGLDFDFRDRGGALDTTDAAARATFDRPQPDQRGVISYPNYQVAVAQRGDTLGTLATRIGLPVTELASYNGLSETTPLREGEVVALPRRVAEPSGGPLTPGGAIDVTTIAGSAIDRAPGTTIPATPLAAPGNAEPVRHQVQRGETAYTIARLYNVSPRALQEWNGLGPDLAVREGSFLIIPVVDQATPAADLPESSPGEGTATPLPPSADQPLPDEDTGTAATEKPAPPSPDLGKAATSTTELSMPVAGSIIREYKKGTNEGIDIGAAEGTAVKASADGVVAAITKDANGTPIVVIRHSGNLLTVYAGVDALSVAKGATVKRGQAIGKVRSGSPSFLHFEVREGFESVDPLPYLS